ncbi:MAG: hypothetical protein MJZ19_04885 [Paludibacteraceae bacterium]|nr:hypothetical protein [Paludibacteraceae bacterium]
MGHWKEKLEYERQKKQDEQFHAILSTIIKILGAILTFFFVKLLAPVAQKHPAATLVTLLSLGIGTFVYFNYFAPEVVIKEEIESFEKFAYEFSKNEDYCRRHINKIVAAEGYEKESYAGNTLSSKKIMSSIIIESPQNYSGDGVNNELCVGRFTKISENKYVYQLLKVSDNTLVKLFEFTLDKKDWYLTKIQRGGNPVDETPVTDNSVNVQVNSDSKETNFIIVEGFNIYIPEGFVSHPRMSNIYVLFDKSGADSVYFSYEILSNPKGPYDLNPEACNADYTGNENDLYVSKEGGDEMSSIWREYKKDNKWCLLEMSYDKDKNLNAIYDILAKSN